MEQILEQSKERKIKISLNQKKFGFHQKSLEKASVISNFSNDEVANLPSIQ